MRKILQSELLKLIKSKVFILVFFFPLFICILGLINVFNNNINSIDLWDSVYNQTITLYSGILLPLAITIIISLQWNMEFKNKNILIIYSSPLNLDKFYLIKLISTLIIIFTNLLLLTIILLIASFILIPNSPFRYYEILGPLLILFYSMPFIFLQHLILIATRNFLVSISFGTILTFIGFISINFIIGIFIPTSYMICGGLLLVPNHFLPQYAKILILIIPILSCLIAYLGINLFKKINFK